MGPAQQRPDVANYLQVYLAGAFYDLVMLFLRSVSVFSLFWRGELL